MHKWISRYVDCVDMNEVAAECIVPVQMNLEENRDKAINYVKKETKRLKMYLSAQLVKIDLELNQKLKQLSNVVARTDAKQEEIDHTKKNLEWLEGIQKRVNDIIRF